MSNQVNRNGRLLVYQTVKTKILCHVVIYLDVIKDSYSVLLPQLPLTRYWTGLFNL